MVTISHLFKGKTVSFSTCSSFISPPAFCCHDSGATVLAMAPRHQLLITGGKKGWISILDLPHKHQRQSFQAHDSPVKALAVDPTEDCFISGSSEGNIRVFLTHFSLSRSALHRCSEETFQKGKTGAGEGQRGDGRRHVTHTLACRCRFQGGGSKDGNTITQLCKKRRCTHLPEVLMTFIPHECSLG